MSSKQRIDGVQGYLLHTYPYSETSLILDVFSRDHGRLPLLARGARRPRSARRGVLLGFQRLELGWFGGGEVKTLTKAEWFGGTPLLKGRCLLLGYYLNELLLTLLARDDPHPHLFDIYSRVVQIIASEHIECRQWSDLFNRGPISSVWNIHSWPCIFILDDKGVIRRKNVPRTDVDRSVREVLGIP